MSQFSTYYCADDKYVDVKTKVNTTEVVTQYDDRFYLSNLGSISLDSSKTLYLSEQLLNKIISSPKIGEWNELTFNNNQQYVDFVNAMISDNYYSTSIVRTWKRGYFINTAKVNQSYYPVTPILVGDRTFKIFIGSSILLGNLYGEDYKVNSQNWETNDAFMSNTYQSKRVQQRVINGVNPLVGRITKSDILSAFELFKVTAPDEAVEFDQINQLLKTNRSISVGNIPKLYISAVYSKAKEQVLLISLAEQFIVDSQLEFPAVSQSTIEILLTTSDADRIFKVYSTSWIFMVKPESIGVSWDEVYNSNEYLNYSQRLNNTASVTPGFYDYCTVFGGTHRVGQALGVSVVEQKSGANNNDRIAFMLSYNGVFPFSNLLIREFNVDNIFNLAAGQNSSAIKIDLPFKERFVSIDSKGVTSVTGDIFVGISAFSFDSDRTGVALGWGNVNQNIDAPRGFAVDYGQNGFSVKEHEYTYPNGNKVLWNVIPRIMSNKDAIQFIKGINVDIVKVLQPMTTELVISKVEPNILYVPWTIKGDLVTEVQADVLSTTESGPYFSKLPIETRPYYEVLDQANTDEFRLSDDIDQLLSQHSGIDKSVLLDTVSAKILQWSKSDMLRTRTIVRNKSEVVDKISDAVAESIKDNLTMSDQEKQYVYDSVIDNINQQVDKNLGLITNSTNKSMQNFITTMTLASKDGLTTLLGNIRIAQTNPSELETDLLSKLYDLGYTLDTIQGHANQLDDVIQSIIGFTPGQIIDQIDISNEIALINSTLGEQVNKLVNYVSQAGQSLDDLLSQGFSSASSQIKELISSFDSEIKGAINSLSQSNLDVSKMLDDIINSDAASNYDKALVQRNKDKVIGYNSEFLKAMMDDPYSALSDHVKYMSARVNKLTMSLKASEAAIKLMDTVMKIPDYFLSALSGFGNILLLVINFAINGAVEAVTIIDNIDKINFIAEQFVTVRSKFSTDIPTATNNLFEMPTLTPSGYPDFSNGLAYEMDIKSGILDVYNDMIDNWVANGYIDISGNSISVSKWDPSFLFSESSSSYFMSTKNFDSVDKALPILKISGNKVIIVPYLYNYVPEYPQRGNVHLVFAKQLLNLANEFGFKHQISVDDASPYLPVNPQTVAAYSGFIVTAGAIAATAAVAAAGMKGDWIGMISGAIAASATVMTANGFKLQEIINQRHYLGENKTVYERLAQIFKELGPRFRDGFKTADGSLDTVMLTKSQYVLYNSSTDNPIVTDASQIKKTFIYVKEILSLVANMVTMIGASFIIGKISAKIGRIIKNKKVYKSQKRQFKNERAQLQTNHESFIKEKEAEKQAINNDPDLTEDQKQEKIDEIDSTIKDATKAYKGESVMIPKTKQEIWTYISNNTGFSNEISVSSVGSDILSATDIGTQFTDQLGQVYNDAVSYFSDKQNGVTDNNNSDSMSSIVDGVTAVTSSISDVLKGIADVKSDTSIIKKYT